MPEELLREGFRQAVLQFLAKEWAISEELRSRMLEWRQAVLEQSREFIDRGVAGISSS